MTNFWAAYKRDFWKIAAVVMLVAFLKYAYYAFIFIRPQNAVLMWSAGFLSSLIIEFLRFTFYCALAVFFFESKKGRLAELLAKYFYVPVILTVCSLAVNQISGYATAYASTNNFQLTVAGHYIPYAWISIPFTLLDGLFSVLILFVFLLAVCLRGNWLKPFGIFLSRYKNLFMAFLWWQFCIGVIVNGITFAGGDIFYKFDIPFSYLFGLASTISLLLQTITIYFVFQKAGAE